MPIVTVSNVAFSTEEAAAEALHARMFPRGPSQERVWYADKVEYFATFDTTSACPWAASSKLASSEVSIGSSTSFGQGLHLQESHIRTCARMGKILKWPL